MKCEVCCKELPDMEWVKDIPHAKAYCEKCAIGLVYKTKKIN